MSSICELCDDLLVKILSSLKTKDAVATSLLSKRWVTLWKLVPRLEYCAPLHTSGSDFIENFLLLSKAPILENFHVKLNGDAEPNDQERWVNIAGARRVRVLELLYYRFQYCPMPCPSSLFTCKGLVVLRLQDVVIHDIPSTLYLQSIKTLSLLRVRFFSDDDLFHRLLSACSILLETLIVQRWFRGKRVTTTYTIALPALQSLYIMDRPDGGGLEVGYYVINTPSLKTLIFLDKLGWFRSLVKMPKLVKAEIKIKQEDSKNVMGCLTSAKHLSLCLTSNTSPLMAKPGAFFCHLENLELCSNCSLDWFSLPLRHSRKLRVLRLNHDSCPMGRGFKDQWEQPCCVPECLVSSLETVEWIGYTGKNGQKEVAIYIFDKANHLKNMTLYFPKYVQLRTLVDLTSRVSSCNKFRLEVVPLEHH